MINAHAPSREPVPLSSANTIADVAAVKFRFGAIKLVEKLIFDVTYEKIGVARSHFATHSDAVDLFVVRVRTGHGNPGKSWNFILAFSRTGKSWKINAGPGNL